MKYFRFITKEETKNLARNGTLYVSNPNVIRDKTRNFEGVIATNAYPTFQRDVESMNGRELREFSSRNGFSGTGDRLVIFETDQVGIPISGDGLHQRVMFPENTQATLCYCRKT